MLEVNALRGASGSTSLTVCMRFDKDGDHGGQKDKDKDGDGGQKDKDNDKYGDEGQKEKILMLVSMTSSENSQCGRSTL